MSKFNDLETKAKERLDMNRDGAINAEDFNTTEGKALLKQLGIALVAVFVTITLFLIFKR